MPLESLRCRPLPDHKPCHRAVPTSDSHKVPSSFPGIDMGFHAARQVPHPRMFPRPHQAPEMNCQCCQSASTKAPFRRHPPVRPRFVSQRKSMAASFWNRSHRHAALRNGAEAVLQAHVTPQRHNQRLAWRLTSASVLYLIVAQNHHHQVAISRSSLPLAVSPPRRIYRAASLVIMRRVCGPERHFIDIRA